MNNVSTPNTPDNLFELLLREHCRLRARLAETERSRRQLQLECTSWRQAWLHHTLARALGGDGN